MSNIIERIKDGMCESAKVYGWVDSVWGTIRNIDLQVEAGFEKGKFPFPVFYAIRTPDLKIFTVYVEKDLTEGVRSGYTGCITKNE